MKLNLNKMRKIDINEQFRWNGIFLSVKSRSLSSY